MMEQTITYLFGRFARTHMLVLEVVMAGSHHHWSEGLVAEELFVQTVKIWV